MLSICGLATQQVLAGWQSTRSGGGAECSLQAANVRPVAGNVIRHVRDGGTMSSAVQVPDGANEGERIKIVGIFAHDDAAILQQVADAAGRGSLTIPVAQTFPLEQLGDAHTALAAGARGRILLRH